MLFILVLPFCPGDILGWIGRQQGYFIEDISKQMPKLVVLFQVILWNGSRMEVADFFLLHLSRLYCGMDWQATRNSLWDSCQANTNFIHNRFPGTLLDGSRVEGAASGQPNRILCYWEMNPGCGRSKKGANKNDNSDYYICSSGTVGWFLGRRCGWQEEDG